MDRCSIIIPVFNRAFLTRQCLDKLLASPPSTCAVEIIVVDDDSSDSTPRLLAAYGNRIRAIRQPRNAGFATACNTGAEAAQGNILLFLNNDTIPLAGWLDAMMQCLRRHPKAGAVGSKLLYPNGTIQHAGVVISQDRLPRHIYPTFPSDHPAVNKSRCFQIVTGASLLAPRQLFHKLEGFDTRFRNGYEDVDLCLRIGELGYEVHYCHDSVLYHLESVTEGRYDFEDANHQAYMRRWHSRVQPDDIQYFLEDGLLQLRYASAGRIGVAVSPLLAAIDDQLNCHATDALLGRRAEQVHELLKENIKLRVAITAAREQSDASLVLPPGPTLAA